MSQALHYRDKRFDTDAAKILPGGYLATGDPMMLVTVLGSCVAACLWDDVAGVGGMNHFMLPGENDGGCARYGAHAMEVLINDLIGRGARRNGLRAKVFGGAAVIRGMTVTHVGDHNAAFVRDYLATEHIPIVAADLGDACPRRVHFFPTTGRALVRRLPLVEARDAVTAERAYQRELVAKPAAGAVELF